MQRGRSSGWSSCICSSHQRPFHCKGFKECNAPNPTHTEASQVCNGDAKAAACLKCQEGRRWIKPWRFAVHCNLALSRLICNLLCNTVGIVPYLGSLEKKPLEAIAITTDRITMYTKHQLVHQAVQMQATAINADRIRARLSAPHTTTRATGREPKQS